MSAIDPSSFRRRLERQWADRIRSLRQIQARLVVAAVPTWRRLSGNDEVLIPVRVHAARRPVPRRSRD